MPTFSTECYDGRSIQPNSTILAEIEACQAAANTTYCFPPNGTRICVPATDIPFFWPISYYHSDAKVALSWDPTSNMVLLRNNTGNDTQDYTWQMYENDRMAMSIPGVENEKTMEMSILERRFNDVDEPFNIKVHEGPTLILVKTEEFPSPTSASSRPSATSDDDSDSDSDDDDEDDDDGPPRLRAGVIAAIVIGSIVGAVLIFFLGCCACCRPVREKGKEDQEHDIEHGVELTEQKGDAGKVVSEGRVGLNEDGISRVEEGAVKQRRSEEEVPPPKYTP